MRLLESNAGLPGVAVLLAVPQRLRPMDIIFTCPVLYKGGRRRREGGDRTNFLLVLVVWPLTTHAFRDGALFLPHIETPPIFGLSSRLFHTSLKILLHISSPPCFTVCGHRPSWAVCACVRVISSFYSVSQSRLSVHVGVSHRRDTVNQR